VIRACRTSSQSLREVVQFWRLNGLKESTVDHYCRWIRAFRHYCEQRELEDLAELTAVGCLHFSQSYARGHRVSADEALRCTRPALRAWRSAMSASGIKISPWASIAPTPAGASALIVQFLEYRRLHEGVSASTLRHDRVGSQAFLNFTRKRGQSLPSLRLLDVDAYMLSLRRRLAPISVVRDLCTVRAFLRFLHVSGRLCFDLSGSVMAPSVKRFANPPRALPWSEVRRILRTVDRTTRIGSRDYAILLLMSVYGLGAAEVIGLCLDDIDWERRTLCVRRPKTGSRILLPLLSPVAQALANYIRRSRPRPCEHRQVFMRFLMPYQPFSESTAIGHILTKYGRMAGVTRGALGSHVLRHSQATRQVELGTSLKIVGDILGHRGPQTTSGYTRSAIRNLRNLSLPLPNV